MTNLKKILLVIVLTALFGCGKSNNEKATSSQSTSSSDPAKASQMVRELAKNISDEDWAFCERSTSIIISLIEREQNRSKDENDTLEILKADLIIFNRVEDAKVENGSNRNELDTLALSKNSYLMNLVLKDPNSPELMDGWKNNCRDKLRQYIK